MWRMIDRRWLSAASVLLRLVCARVNERSERETLLWGVATFGCASSVRVKNLAQQEMSESRKFCVGKCTRHPLCFQFDIQKEQ